jgi:chorismate mutase/prephenate dehydratase
MARRKSGREAVGAKDSADAARGGTKPRAKASAQPRAKARGASASTTPSQAASGADALAPVRERISAIDASLVRLLNDRAELVMEVGRVKREAGLPVYTPHREAQVLEKVLKSNPGPMPERLLESIFREIMSGSMRLQQAVRVGYLGPPGSYSHQAASKHFGGSADFVDLATIQAVFTEVQRGHVQCGLAPIENSTGGGIVESLDALRDGAVGHGRGQGAPITICAEVQLAVRHALLGLASPSRISTIYSKPEVFQQCHQWLTTQYPRAELVATASSSQAAQQVAKRSRAILARGGTPDFAAIGSELAGALYGLDVLVPGVEDDPDNVTRFVVISRQESRRTGDDKTSVMFTTSDTPGALVHVLAAFERERINLTHIEKRPSGRRNWTYTFFVDAQGHREDPAVARALEGAQGHCRELVVLGSYPRSKRIL